MITVICAGLMGKHFGRRHRLDVSTAAEALRALQANYPGLRAWLHQHRATPFRVLIGPEAIDESGLVNCTARSIKFVPLVSGRGAFGKIVLGGLLIAFAPQLGLLFGQTVAGGYFVAGLATSIGTSLVLGGISQLLFKPPKTQSTERPENKPSYAFDGAVNTVTQGNCVPLLYGELIVGSQVISSGLSVEQLA